VTASWSKPQKRTNDASREFT